VDPLNSGDENKFVLKHIKYYIRVLFHLNVNVMLFTKEVIKEKLSTDVRWMERGLVVLFNRQTEDEQDSSQTSHLNGMGFNGRDSQYLTYVSKYIISGGNLSGKHIEWVGKKLPKYWRQIQEEIELKQGVS
jgi:hypothetical protein